MTELSGPPRQRLPEKQLVEIRDRAWRDYQRYKHSDPDGVLYQPHPPGWDTLLLYEHIMAAKGESNA